MQTIKYLHEIQNPILPAVGDIRVVPVLKYKTTESGKIPDGKIYIVKCIEIRKHHAVYEYLGQNRAEAIPFEMVADWGMLNIDSAVKWILNSFMEDIIKDSDVAESNSFAISPSITRYFNRLKDLITLSRSVLKEAEKARKTLATSVNKGN